MKARLEPTPSACWAATRTSRQPDSITCGNSSKFLLIVVCMWPPLSVGQKATPRHPGHHALLVLPVPAKKITLCFAMSVSEAAPFSAFHGYSVRQRSDKSVSHLSLRAPRCAGPVLTGRWSSRHWPLRTAWQCWPAVPGGFRCHHTPCHTLVTATVTTRRVTLLSPSPSLSPHTVQSSSSWQPLSPHTVSHSCLCHRHCHHTQFSRRHRHHHCHHTVQSTSSSPPLSPHTVQSTSSSSPLSPHTVQSTSSPEIIVMVCWT